MRLESCVIPSVEVLTRLNLGLSYPDSWNGVFEDPAKMLSTFFETEDPESQARLYELEESIHHAGLFYDAGIPDEIDPEIKLIFEFKFKECTTAIRFHQPFAGKPSTAVVNWEAPASYLDFFARSDGAEWFRVDSRHQNVDGTVTLEESIHAFLAGAKEIEDFTETLRGEDFLKDIFADPENYGFTTEHLTINAYEKHFAFFMDSNSNYYCFHNNFFTKTSDCAILPWMHDAEGGFEERFRLAANNQGDFVWWLLLSLSAFAKDEDCFDRLAGE